MLFASPALVRRIEQAEARSLHSLVEGRDADTFALPLAGGYALYRGASSPLNKVVGLGFVPCTEAELAGIELRYHAIDAAVQVELSTYADPDLTRLLTTRGYQFSGFENVLGQKLDASLAAPVVPAELDVRRAGAGELEPWVDVLAAGFSQLVGDEKEAAHDVFDRAALERAFRDMGQHPRLERWLAFRRGQVAGGASAMMQDDILQLFGAATHPSHRRQGVQASLLSKRLHAGRDAGGELAVVTTQTGSQSQHNVQRAGFDLLYSRAVWVLAPSPSP